MDHSHKDGLSLLAVFFSLCISLSNSLESPKPYGGVFDPIPNTNTRQDILASRQPMGVMDESAVRQLKVAELRGELTNLGLPTGGKKDELQARLLEALQSSAVGDSTAPANQSKPVNPSRPSKPTSPASPTSQPASYNPSDKMAERAARFKIEPVGSGDERLKKRKERFGSISEDFFDMEKLKARQARFGVVTSERLAQDDLNAQKVKRLQRFGLNS
jgi:hypothetical protein